MPDIHSLATKHQLGTVSFVTFRRVLLVLCGVAVVCIVLQISHLLPVIGETVYGEAGAVLTAQRWAAGLPMYEDYRRPPYLSTSFPPLWYAIVALPARFGYSDLDSLTLFGRILSIMSVCGLTALVYSWNRRIGHSAQNALLTSMLYLSFPVLIPWAVTARPDLISLLLAFGALYAVGLRTNTKTVSIAAIFAGCAFVMRHNIVAVPVSIVIWLACARKWKEIAVFCSLWLISVVVVISTFTIVDLELLQLNLSGAKFGNFSVSYIRDMFARLFCGSGNGFAVLLFACGVFSFITCDGEARDTLLLRIYAVATCALAALATAAAGGAMNHYLEPALSMAMLTPFGFARLENEWKKASTIGGLLVIVLLCYLLPSLDWQRSASTHNNAEQFGRTLPLLGHRRVFTDIPYLASRKAGPELIDLASLINSERAGGMSGWSSVGVTKALNSREYELVILSQRVEEAALPGQRYPRAPRLNAEIVGAIRKNYVYCYEADNVFLYAADGDRSAAGLSKCPAAEASEAVQAVRQ